MGSLKKKGVWIILLIGTISTVAFQIIKSISKLKKIVEYFQKVIASSLVEIDYFVKYSIDLEEGYIRLLEVNEQV